MMSFNYVPASATHQVAFHGSPGATLTLGSPGQAGAPSGQPQGIGTPIQTAMPVTYVQMPATNLNTNNVGLIPAGQPMIFQMASHHPHGQQTTYLTTAQPQVGASAPQAPATALLQPQYALSTTSQSMNSTPQYALSTTSQPVNSLNSTPQNPLIYMFEVDTDMDTIKATLPAIPSGDKWIRGITGPNFSITSLELYDPEEEEKPKYVNPKQFQRILKRRAEREKLIRQGRIPEERAKYLHESRHRHALNRTRLKDGRFHSKG